MFIHQHLTSRSNSKNMRWPLMLTLALAAVTSTHAETVARWDFNSAAPDDAVSTGSLLPTVGLGLAVALPGSTATFASGSGSSDATGSDNSAWNLSTFAPQGQDDRARGFEFQVSTLGFDRITVSFDMRHTATAARHEIFQYALDGVNFIDHSLLMPTASSTWEARQIDLSGIAGISNNPLLALRLVAGFEPGTQAYQATGSASNYSTLGTWRTDSFSVVGSPVVAVPESQTHVMLLAGLLCLACVRRWQSKA